MNSQHTPSNLKDYFVVKIPILNASFKDFWHTKINQIWYGEYKLLGFSKDGYFSFWEQGYSLSVNYNIYGQINFFGTLKIMLKSIVKKEILHKRNIKEFRGFMIG